MTILQAVASGVLQGIAEFFPISSTGHLVLLHHYFGFQESQIVFDIFLHIATGLAVLIYFWHDVTRLFTSQKSLAKLVLIGCIPTFIIGFLFADVFEKFFVNIKLVGAAIIVTGIWLFVANFVNKKFLHEVHAESKGTVLYVWKAIVIGTAQGIALIPGISRSGATIATGLLCGLGSSMAFRFSFLLLLPATLGAAVFKLKYVTSSAPPLYLMLIGAACAFAVGLLALNMLSRILKKGRIHIFSLYCIAVGLFVLFFK
jgi:undecaprenyl-diphosphatase